MPHCKGAFLLTQPADPLAYPYAKMRRGISCLGTRGLPKLEGQDTPLQG